MCVRTPTSGGGFRLGTAAIAFSSRSKNSVSGARAALRAGTTSNNTSASFAASSAVCTSSSVGPARPKPAESTMVNAGNPGRRSVYRTSPAVNGSTSVAARCSPSRAFARLDLPAFTGPTMATVSGNGSTIGSVPAGASATTAGSAAVRVSSR